MIEHLPKINFKSLDINAQKSVFWNFLQYGGFIIFESHFTIDASIVDEYISNISTSNS